MTVDHSELFTAEFSAKHGDDRVTAFLFATKFSAVHVNLQDRRRHVSSYNENEG